MHGGVHAQMLHPACGFVGHGIFYVVDRSKLMVWDIEASVLLADVSLAGLEWHAAGAVIPPGMIDVSTCASSTALQFCAHSNWSPSSIHIFTLSDLAVYCKTYPWPGEYKHAGMCSALYVCMQASVLMD